MNSNDLLSCLPTTIVAPVSGHGMVEQTGIMLNLATMGYVPKLCLGASGGSLALGIMNYNDWDYERVMHWLQGIPNFEIFRSGMFGMAAGVVCQNIYDPGQGLEYIFKCISKSCNHLETEIIITAQNNTSGRLEIFSTVKRADSTLQQSGPLLLVGTTCEITYLGDIEDINEYYRRVELVLRATSAVPIVFAPINIDGSLYVDGGVGFSSPLSPFMTVNQLKDILYIFPEDIDLPNPQTPKSAIDAAASYLSQVSRSNYIHDRISYLQTISCGQMKRLHLIEGDASTFAESVCMTYGKKRMVEMFPVINRALPIMSKQSRHDVLQRLGEQENFKFRIFYIE